MNAALTRQQAKALLKRIQRYHGMGLTLPEICLLVDMQHNTVCKHIREMEAFGLLEAPSNRAIQAAAGRLQ